MYNPLVAIRSISSRVVDTALQDHQRAITFAGLLATCLISAGYGLLVGSGFSFLYLLIAPIAIIGVWMVFMLPDYASLALLGFRWGFIFDAFDSSLGLQSPSLPLAVLLLVVLAVQCSGRRKRRFVSDPIFWVLLVYLGHVAFGVWYAAFPDLVTTRVNDFSKDILYTIVVMNFLTAPRLLEQSTYLLALVGALLGTLTVYQEVTQTYDNTYWDLAKVKIAFIVEGEVDRPRAAGPLGDPNFYGQQLLVLVPLALWWVIHARSWWQRIVAIYCVAAILAGVGLSYSRGALLAVAAMLAVYFTLFRIKLKYLAYFTPIVIVAFLAAPPELKARFSTLTQFLASEEEKEAQVMDNSFQGRSRYLTIGQNMVLDSPLVGLGADHFKARFTQYVLELGESPDSDANRNAHNYYLEVITEHGLVGLSLVMAMMIMSLQRFYQARITFLRLGNVFMADLSGFFLVSFVGYMISAIFLHGDYPRFLWLTLGVAIAMGYAARQTLAQHASPTAPDAPPHMPGTTI